MDIIRKYMSKVLHLYVIHTQKLALRFPRLQATIETIRSIAQKGNYEVRVRMITTPDPEHLQSKIEALDKRINYDKVGIEDFDKAIMMLTLEQLSNYEKHRDVWRHVCDEANGDLFFVIEDDCFTLPDMPDGFARLLEMDHTSYDFLLLSMSKDTHQGNEFLDIRDVTNILPSKDAYFLSKRAARVFLDQSEIIKFNMRNQLSYMLFKNPSLNAKYFSKRIMLEGSKVGMYASSLNANNILIYNAEYMQLLKMLGDEEVDVRNVRAVYRKIAHLQSADIMHIYAVLLYKGREIKEAQDALLDAIELAKKQQGVLNCNSDLINNTINIHEFTQWDLEGITKNPSKYKN